MIRAELDTIAVTVGLLGGLAIFLFGMGHMTDALKTAAGGGMRKILGKLTKNRFSGAITGALVTAVIQSSSVTTVLVVGFISAGLMTLAQSVGVIMGANVGTTITAQIVAFNVTEYALGLIAIGFASSFLGRREVVRHVGAVVLGLGLIFLGMGQMSAATTPLRTYQPFIDLMARMDSPLLGVAAGAGFTAIVQSSSATTGIVIMLASQGFISLEAGIALALGSNVGTCATAALAAVGKPTAAAQAAAVHIVFNVLGALLWVGLIPQLADVVRSVSPSFADLASAERLAAETPRQIANAHTLFNIANTAIFIWFTGPIARLVERMLPDRPEPVPESARPKYLDEAFLDTPALALDRLQLEIARLGELSSEAYRASVGESEMDVAELAQRASDGARLYESILGYARRIAREDLGSRDSRGLEQLILIANHWNSLLDSLSSQLGRLVTRWRDGGLAPSDETRAQYRSLSSVVGDVIQSTAEVVKSLDVERAAEILEMGKDVNGRADSLRRRIGERLTEDDEHRLRLYQLEIEVIETILRLHYFAHRIAKTVVASANPDPEA